MNLITLRTKYLLPARIAGALLSAAGTWPSIAAAQPRPTTAAESHPTIDTLKTFTNRVGTFFASGATGLSLRELGTMDGIQSIARIDISDPYWAQDPGR